MLIVLQSEVDVCPLCKKPRSEEAMDPINMQDAPKPFDTIALRELV